MNTKTKKICSHIIKYLIVPIFFLGFSISAPRVLNGQPIYIYDSDHCYYQQNDITRLITDTYYFGEYDPKKYKKPRITAGNQKGVYMTGYSIGVKSKREQIYDLIENTELNSIVFNVKDDGGYINYDTDIDFAIKNKTKNVLYDINQVISEMHARNIYAIARIVVFKDPVIANARPEMAIKDSRDGSPLYSEGSYWPDMYCEEYWDYIIEIVKEVSKLGIDEIQFDYIRGPAKGNIKYADYTYNTDGSSKSEAICKFLEKARKSLEGTGIKMSADIFGFVLIENNDQGIGQMVQEIAPYLDYIYPMVYPSHYSNGFMGFDMPENHPYEVVKYSLEKGIPKIKDSGCMIIPWLQAFGLKMSYTKNHILEEISASEELGIKGFLFWNASNNYDIVEEALKNRNPE